MEAINDRLEFIIIPGNHHSNGSGKNGEFEKEKKIKKKSNSNFPQSIEKWVTQRKVHMALSLGFHRSVRFYIIKK